MKYRERGSSNSLGFGRSHSQRRRAPLYENQANGGSAAREKLQLKAMVDRCEKVTYYGLRIPPRRPAFSFLLNPYAPQRRQARDEAVTALRGTRVGDGR
jgi:hypothetical protein